MKKRFLLIPAVGLPLLAAIPAISSYASVTNSKVSHNNTDVVNQTTQNDVNNYSVVTPSWTHYAVGEKLDLRDLKVTYNDPEKGVIDVTNECKLSKQNNEELLEAGEFDVNIQHNDFNSSFKIYVEKEPTEVPNTNNDAWLCNICVKFKLMSNQECIFTEYEAGEGILEIPDFIERDGVKYFIKQIPSDWSDGENDITGLKFADAVSHLKKICNHAFYNTNCLDYYINHKDELLKFPEGLEEIGNYAFCGTDYGQNKIKGYLFPSTLKMIGEGAFASSPNIKGDSNNGWLIFKSMVEIKIDAFTTTSSINFAVYGKTLEMSQSAINQIMQNKLQSFENIASFSVPKIVDENDNPIEIKVVEKTWKDIKVKCALFGDECKLTGYVEGKGTILIPDYVEEEGKIYYVKEISSEWSNGENNIEGLEFANDVSHLKIIRRDAFKNTNCLDYYINNKNSLLKFPEGLEEIGESAFYGTDYGINKIKGYSFPSTLKKIGFYAFGYNTPYIDGDDNNGVLEFRSIPEMHSCSFYIHTWAKHDCKFIRGKTKEMAEQIVELIKNNMSRDFNTDSDYLIPEIIKE